MLSSRPRILVLLIVVLVNSAIATTEAHRSGCHRRHSCPSDHGTYVCGGLGDCSQCPDNEYCLAGKPRVAAQTPATPSKPTPAQPQMVTVQRVVGGDTLELSTREPVQYFGKEATAFTKRLVEGKRIRLEYDQKRLDRCGRTLAYVYLEHGTFVNAEIIRQGFGFAYIRFPFKHLEEFRQLEREAREAKRGLWGER